MKSGQLILRNIIKSVATRCQILRLKCTKIDFSWGSAQTSLLELTALLQTPSWNKGVLRLRERAGRGGEERDGKGEEGRG